MDANNQQLMVSQDVVGTADSGLRVLDISFGNGHGKKMRALRSGPSAF